MVTCSQCCKKFDRDYVVGFWDAILERQPREGGAPANQPTTTALCKPKAASNSAMDAISALRDLFYACIRADAAGELSAIVNGGLLDRAKAVLKRHQ